MLYYITTNFILLLFRQGASYEQHVFTNYSLRTAARCTQRDHKQQQQLKLPTELQIQLTIVPLLTETFPPSKVFHCSVHY